MIGTSERARSSRHTSKPSRSGRPRSSSTTSKSPCALAVERVAAGLDPVDLEALALEPLGEGRGDGVVVLDDQDSHGSAALSRSGAGEAASGESVDTPGGTGLDRNPVVGHTCFTPRLRRADRAAERELAARPGAVPAPGGGSGTTQALGDGRGADHHRVRHHRRAGRELRPVRPHRTRLTGRPPRLARARSPRNGSTPRCRRLRSRRSRRSRPSPPTTERSLSRASPAGSPR